MAFRYATKNGNWSDVSVWDGGAACPGNTDMVYSNGKTVTIDQDVTIGGANNADVNSGSFVVDQWYVIKTVGTTNFTLIGATANTVGFEFIATGVGTGNGVATTLAALSNAAKTSLSVVAGGGFSIVNNYTLDVSVLQGGAGSNLTLSSNCTVTINGYVRNTGSGAGAVNCQTANCTLAVNGRVIGGGNAAGINWTGGGPLTVTGDVYGGTATSGHGITLNTTVGTVTINGSVYSGTAGANYGISFAGSHATTSVLTISGNVIGGANTAALGCPSGTGIVTVEGYAQGGANVGAVHSGGSTNLTINGGLLGGGAGGALTFSSTDAAAVVTVNGAFTNNGTNGLMVTASHTGTLHLYCDVTGHATNSAAAFTVQGTGSTTIHGDVTAGATGTALSFASNAPTMTITGNVLGVGTKPGLTVSGGAPVVTINGNVTAGAGAAGYGAFISTMSGGSLTVLGNVVAGAVAAGIYGLLPTGNPPFTVNGSVTASSGANGIYFTGFAHMVVTKGGLYDDASGYVAVSSSRIRLATTPAGKEYRKALDGASTYYTLHTTDTWAATQAAPGDVRYPTAYGAGGALAGTCHVPAAASVAAGALVDATVGTAVLSGAQIPSAADVAAAVRLNLAIELGLVNTNLDGKVSEAGGGDDAAVVAAAVWADLESPELERLRNCATVASTGAQLAAL